MTDSPTSQAMHLAMTELEYRRERIAELKEALRRYVAQDEIIGLVNNDVYRTARALLNNGTSRGGCAAMEPATEPVNPADFVEHTHPDYGPGYFCTPDVHARITARSVLNKENGNA